MSYPKNHNLIVDYRFGDKYSVYAFVTPKNPDIVEISRKLDGIQAIAKFVRDGFTYPLANGQPSADGQMVRFKKDFFNYQFKKCVYYMWSFPAECLFQQYGICIDTANVCTSLMRSQKFVAWTALGEVRSYVEDTLLGSHAWTVIEWLDTEYVDETTIHDADKNPLVLRDNVCDRNSEWAKLAGVYYVEQARYNEKEYHPTGDLGHAGIIFRLMGLPTKPVEIYGLENVEKMKPKKVYKEWRKDQLQVHRGLTKAWEY